MPTIEELAARLEALEETVERGLEGIQKRLYDGVERFAGLENRVHQTELLIATHAQHVAEVKELLVELKELVETFSNLRGAVKTVATIGNALKWTFGLGAAGVGLYAALSGIRAFAG